MRPQDVAILLKIIALNNEKFNLTDLSATLFISLSEISESLNRSKSAQLLAANKKRVMRQNLFEFLEHGVKYVFPAEPGKYTRGIATAHSYKFIKERIESEIEYVWPSPEGNILGLMIEPFFNKQVEAARLDETFYKLLALVDVIRVGKVREVKMATKELKEIIHES
ncbi:MAG: hypothetical protein EOP53_06010 [Sphingobacteriales bacterium]|nr:MAG: hypothetical protein EOP53_06010 [Sphingobacteriales bacterium]